MAAIGSLRTPVPLNPLHDCRAWLVTHPDFLTLSYIGLASLTAYTASKSAVVGVTRTLAVELAPHGIRVNAVSPGFTFSGMNVALQGDTAFMAQMRLDYLIPSLGQPEGVAYAVLHLASDEARFTTGASLVVDGGHTIK